MDKQKEATRHWPPVLWIRIPFFHDTEFCRDLVVGYPFLFAAADSPTSCLLTASFTGTGPNLGGKHRVGEATRPLPGRTIRIASMPPVGGPLERLQDQSGAAVMKLRLMETRISPAALRDAPRPWRDLFNTVAMS